MYRFVLRLLLSTIAFFFSMADTYGQQGEIYYRTVPSFFPESKILPKHSIEWAILDVPENYDVSDSTNIHLAVATIPQTGSNRSRKNPMLFIQGGPGAGSIATTWRWLSYPIRNDRDIGLIDVRGTGFSSPSLCPDLGETFFEILAADLSTEQEIAERVKAASVCRLDILKKGLDLQAYNSRNIAKDIHHAMKGLKYSAWNVYGGSYGTHIALEYARQFPEDISAIVLDSPIPPYSQYYSHNTKNFHRSLSLLFDRCRQDPQCNLKFEDLEQIFYQTLDKLDNEPLIVPMSKDALASGRFVFNRQDFLIAVHQSLYDPKLFQVVPLMIAEINSENIDLVSSLLSSLGKRLTLDYGTYYCVLCNETIPSNSFDEFKAPVDGALRDVSIPFYEAEFSICKVWDNHAKDTLGVLTHLQIPGLVVNGEFDPIVSHSEGQQTAHTLNAFYIDAFMQGHGPTFSSCGNQVVANFLNDSRNAPDTSCFKVDQPLFRTDIVVQSGVARLAGSVMSADYVFLFSGCIGDYPAFHSGQFNCVCDENA